MSLRSVTPALVAALSTLVLARCAPPSADPPPDDEGPAQKIYVANEDSGSISVIDGETLSVSATISLGGADMPMPHNLQVAPDGASVWVTAAPMMEGGEDKLLVLDPSVDEIVEELTLGNDLHLAHVVLSADSSAAFVTASESAEVLHLDTESFAVVARHALAPGAYPHGARVCGGRVYVAEMDGMSLAVIDHAADTLEEIDVGGIAVQAACTPDQRYVFVTLYDTKEVVRLEVDTEELVRIALPAEAQGPVQSYPSPDGTRLYVADQGVLLDRPASNKLYVIDVEAAAVTDSVDVGQGAHGVVVEAGGARAFVTNLVDGTVSVVDTGSLTVTDTIEVGAAPNGISCWHGDAGMP
jgi:YVTN family beta-propeller protein